MKKKDAFKPNIINIVITIVLLILSSVLITYPSSSEVIGGRPQVYYGAPASIGALDTLSGSFEFSYFGIIINLIVYYIVSCLIYYGYGSLKKK